MFYLGQQSEYTSIIEYLPTLYMSALFCQSSIKITNKIIHLTKLVVFRSDLKALKNCVFLRTRFFEGA